MEIRPLTDRDSVALLTLVQGLAGHHGDQSAATSDTLTRDLSDGWTWGFGAGDPLIGYVLMMRHARVHDGLRGVDLHHVFVTPSARRQGIARALLTRAEDDARSKGCSYVVIGAHEGNSVARDAYVGLGYEWRAPIFWRFFKRL
ncbi:GNAT family N-acetyltransferase [Jannaschia rubra]|uniref:Putative acetyltransferase n=1 Tax=Jannaschia rubra TaxID=282197 RepID=A0A0M6XPA3_9RHOB|nr:GNAT family N-acetyltransferase [Jannaschia rubra]CTQ32996.1 putative acetyltransferase [Jannaschia rubra]SFG59184.1 Acetyltransferase (GNAT) family protein [Jannaschia rubra]